jgi:hypothetical protein
MADTVAVKEALDPIISKSYKELEILVNVGTGSANGATAVICSGENVTFLILLSL